MADESVGDDDVVRRRIKAMVRDRFGIHHTTLEIERPGADCEEDVVVIGHQICTAGHDHADGGQP